MLGESHPDFGPGSTVVVSGAAGRLGRRVIALVAEASDVERVVAFDRQPVQVTGGVVESQLVDLARPDGLPQVDRADALVHLAFAVADARGRAAQEANVGGTRRLLELAERVGTRHVVVVSSATAYGAWANNPVPITEDAPLRPDPEFAYAVHKAEIEQMVDEWVRSEPGRTAAVLRPCTTLDEAGGDWLAQALAAGAGVLAPADDPPMQFLHMNDLAAAVELARRSRLDGPLNVAPDGWVSGARLRALAGATPRVRLPGWMLHWVTSLRWRFQQGPIPPGLLPYLSHPWVVANDRLKAAGWRPTVTNEQAYVAGTEAAWWQTLSPQRRQELALGGGAVAVAGAVGAAAWAVERVVRARR